MDGNRRGIEFVDSVKDAAVEFVEGIDVDVAQGGAGHFREGHFSTLRCLPSKGGLVEWITR